MHRRNRSVRGFQTTIKGQIVAELSGTNRQWRADTNVCPGPLPMKLREWMSPTIPATCVFEYKIFMCMPISLYTSRRYPGPPPLSRSTRHCLQVHYVKQEKQSQVNKWALGAAGSLVAQLASKMVYRLASRQGRVFIT